MNKKTFTDRDKRHILKGASNVRSSNRRSKENLPLNATTILYEYVSAVTKKI